MSNSSGITPAPPGGIKSSSGGQVVPIKSLPDGLQSVSRPLHLEGEVVAQNQDGSTRIKTAEGTIDITIRGRQPQPGQKIEIDLPAGNPPRQATLRTPPAQPQTSPPAQTPASPAAEEAAQQPLPPVLTRPASQPPPAQPIPATPVAAGSTAAEEAAPILAQPPAQAGQATPKPALPPLPGSYQPTAASLQALHTPLPPLSPDQNVQMQPIPPAQAQALLQSLAAQLTRTGSLAGATPGQNLPDNLVKILNTALTQAGKPSLIPQNTNTAGNTAQPAPDAATKSPLPGDTNLLGTTNIISQENGTPPSISAETVLKNLLLSPKLPQAEWKIVTIIPPAVPNPPDGEVPGFSKPAPGLVSTASPSLTATVIATAQNHQPLVSIPWPGGGQTVQLLTLQPAAGPLPPGTEIILQPSMPGQTETKPAAPLPLFQSSLLWPAMDDSLQALLQTSPAMAQAMAKLIPSPSQPMALGPAAMLFVAFARLGNVNDWLGEDRIDALTKTGKAGLLSRLSSDAANIARANADTPPGDWRSYPIPFLWQNDVSRVMLHIKRDAPEKDGQEKEGTTRFIFDLDLPRMGDVQLDGLLRGQRLDLIVRTELPISLPMQESMKKAYADALDGTDVFGELGFQGDMRHWVQVVRQHRNLGVSA